MAVGAVCVASVTLEHPVGGNMSKGDDMGHFQFGGSTVVLLFRAGTVAFDDDILFRSDRGVEVYVEQGVRIGTAKL